MSHSPRSHDSHDSHDPHLSSASAPDDAIVFLGRDIVDALERKPAARIPAGFAERVAAQAAARPVMRMRISVSYGRSTAIACAVVLLAASFLLAAKATLSFTSLAFDTELLLLLQLLGIACALAFFPGRRDV